MVQFGIIRKIRKIRKIQKKYENTKIRKYENMKIRKLTLSVLLTTIGHRDRSDIYITIQTILIDEFDHIVIN